MSCSVKHSRHARRLVFCLPLCEEASRAERQKSAHQGWQHRHRGRRARTAAASRYLPQRQELLSDDLVGWFARDCALAERARPTTRGIYEMTMKKGTSR